MDWYRTLLCPTDRAKELATPTDPAMPYRPQCIVLRDRSTKEDIDYDDTPAIEAMRTQLDGFNDNLAGRQVYLDQEPHQVPYLRRIFCDDWCKGGNFYCKGPSFQNLKKRQRHKLTEVIDGITYPLVGLDLKNSHLALMYWERDIPLPEGDLYELEDFDRDTTSKPGHLMMQNGLMTILVV